MNFTAKDEYGILAVMRLAIHTGDSPVQAREIARLEEIPEQFLEQVLAALRRTGIVKSIRGASGGYELAKSPKEITAGDVIRGLSGPIVPTQIKESEMAGGKTSESDVVSDLWKRILIAVSDILDKTTIQDLIDERARRSGLNNYMMYI